MSSNSMDEDEPIASLQFDENNEDYMETCDDEVNDMVPRLERLCINDNELTDLPSGLSIDTVPSSIKNFEGASIADSNGAVSHIFLGDKSDKIWVSEVTKAADGSKKSLSKTEETSQVFSTNTQLDIQSQDVIEKDPESGEIHVHPIDAKEEQILDKTKEMKETGVESVCDESPLDLSPKRNLEHNDEAKSISAVSENKTELKSLMIVPEKMKHVDPETGEITENSSIILPDTPGSNSIGKALVLSADVMDSGIVFDPHSPKLSYSADESSADESHGSSGIMLDSPPDICAVNTASVEDKRYRKITAIVPPVSGMNENRQRRFCIFQPPFSIIDASKTNSSDEESKNSGAIRKDSPINSRRKSRKTVKSSPRLKALNHSDVKNEEKRPSPCKRKKTLSENMTETTGKFRRRSASEHNSNTSENTHLVIRSRSLSPGLKNIHNTSITNPPTENSIISQSRKRSNSDSHNASRVKSRRSSISSEDAENK